MRSWPSAVRRSSVTLLRPRPSTAQNNEYWPSASSVSTNGPIPRMKSPPRRLFDLDDLGALLAEQPGAERCGDARPEVEDAQSREWTAQRFPCVPDCSFFTASIPPCLRASTFSSAVGVFETNWWSMKWYFQLSRWPMPSTMWLIDDFTISAVSGGHERDLLGHLARGVGELGARHDPVHEPVALGLLRREGLRAEQELLRLARSELPRLDRAARPRRPTCAAPGSRTWRRRRRRSGRTCTRASSPAAEHVPCTAAIVTLRKSRMRTSLSKYMVCSCASLPSGVSRIAAQYSSAASSSLRS